MKGILRRDFEAITSQLSSRPFGSFLINGKLELFNSTSISAPSSSSSSSAGGRSIPTESPISAGTIDTQDKILVVRRPRSATIDESPPRKAKQRRLSLGDINDDANLLLSSLIEALNDFFPDHDFHSTTAERFLFLDIGQCMRDVNHRLLELRGLDLRFIHSLWTTINDAVSLKAAEVFSYIPDNIDDPFSDNTIWSFNYFIVDKISGNICYFTCIAKRYIIRSNRF